MRIQSISPQTFIFKSNFKNWTRPSENASCPNFAQTPYSPPISPYSIHNMNLERINVSFE